MHANIHPYSNFNGDLANPPLGLQYRWVITPHELYTNIIIHPLFSLNDSLVILCL